MGHSVEALCRWASEFDTDFETLREEVAALDGYYIPTRYPNGLPDSIPARVYTRSAAEESLRLADQTLRLVRRKLQDR
jgi:HEPN domain-containing protein